MDFKEYSFETLIDDTPFDPSVDDISFVLEDSLFSFFAKGGFSIVDHSSVMLEYRILNDGRKFSISFGLITEDSIPRSNFVLDSFSTKGSNQYGILATTPTHKLTGIESVSLESLSASYEGTVSSIVEEVVGPLGFTKVIVSGSVGSDIWYRPLMDEKEFIEQILLKNALASSDEFSPYFAFSTSDNVFHFEDFKSLMNKTSKETFIYRPSSDTSMDETQLSAIIPFSNGITKGRPSWHRDVISINNKTFEEIHTIRTLPERFSESPLVVGENSRIASSCYGGRIYSETENDLNRIKGQENFRSRNSFFQESFLITTMRPFTSLHSGDKITLAVTTNDEGGYADSLYYSGDYIIERSRHEWQGFEEKGYSEFLVSRASAVIPSDHLIKEKMLS